MAAFDTVIRNGTVATASDTFKADVAIRQGRIAAIGEAIEDADVTVDASGLLVLPGGIDSHVHISQPSGPGIVMADDFESATRAAAFGGNTFVMPYCLQPKGQPLRAALKDYHALADSACYVDHSFHLIIADPSDAVLGQELPALVADGHSSLKIFMTYQDLALSDYEILGVLQVARETGALVQIHAENYDAIRFLTDRLERAGQTAPYYHGKSRPIPVEREATHRAISLAELVDVPILIVHVSGREAVEQIRWARAHGLKVFAETCPQYLFLTAADLGIDDSYHGARCVCSPPPRDKANQEVIWDGLNDGTFTVFSSDHAPFRYDAPEGKKPGGNEVAFRHIPNGIPGIETRLPLLYSEGVLGGRITLNRFVELTSTGPAKAYGLHPRKGTIAVGSDADLVIWEEREFVLTNADLHHDVDYTPYEGHTLRAWPGVTITRGEVVWDGAFRGRAGRGRFLVCGAPSLVPPRPGAQP